jgi:UDP-GlcNAc:undecaprenyl-phosphate GlcNAc-1-phosphate transferase
MHIFSTLRPVIGFVAALAGTLTLTPVARRLARLWGVIDCPDGGRKLQRRPVALLGGVAVFAGVLVGVAVLAGTIPLHIYGVRLPGLLAGMAILCAVGVCDDIWNLPARWKLAGQVVAAVPVMWAGFAIERIGVRSHVLELGLFTIPFSVLWLVIGINALNLIDGMDGLASTSGLCIALGVAATAWVTGADETTMLALTLAGALAGFLAFNFPPASIYLGDAGSMVIGMFLSILALEVAHDAFGRTSLPVMVVLMAVPLGDTSLAILRRGLSGKGIFYADRGHIHHRLLDQGFVTQRVLLIVGGICLLTGAVVVLARTADLDAAAWVASLLLAAALIRARLMGYHEWALLKEFVARRWAGAPAQGLAAAVPVVGLRIYPGDAIESPTVEPDTESLPATKEPTRRAA